MTDNQPIRDQGVDDLARELLTGLSPDRPANNPGGCECVECGRIFIGAEWHIKCGLCAEDAG